MTNGERRELKKEKEKKLRRQIWKNKKRGETRDRKKMKNLRSQICLLEDRSDF
jgi:hypothetical protein